MARVLQAGKTRGPILSARRPCGSRSVLLPFVDAKREPAYVIGVVTYRLDPIPPALESSAAIL
jgi:hypothetical protein